MKKINKGQHNYIKKSQIKVLLITLFMYACAIGIYFFGYYTNNHSYKNIWSIIAVLSILPASKSCVNLIMFLRFKSLSDDIYNEIKENAGTLPTIYELPFTTYEKTYFVEGLSSGNNTVIGYCDYKDLKKLEEHMNNVLNTDGYKNVTIKIFNKRESYYKRLQELNEHYDNESDDLSNAYLNSLKAVTL